MSYLFRILQCLIVFMVPNNVLFGQYDPENEVVTISKYHLKPLSEVENGSAAERKEVLEEYAQKMNPLSTKLKSSMMLGHYWTGSSQDILAVNRWKSIADADESVVSTEEVRKRAWRRDDLREEFMKKYNKYWTGRHDDLEVLELLNGYTKNRKRKPKENTVVTIVRRYMAPLSTVEDGSAEERKELWDEWFENITMENDKLLSQMILRHYWSGTYNPSKKTPIIFIREWASLADAEDDGGWDEPIEAFWPDEEQRKDRLAQGNKYWLGRHEDIGIYRNLVNLQK